MVECMTSDELFRRWCDGFFFGKSGGTVLPVAHKKYIDPKYLDEVRWESKED
jgi:hypothetical protein